MDQLAKEPELMQAECSRVKQQLEDLAFKNYKALISANDCIHEIRLEVANQLQYRATNLTSFLSFPFLR